LSKKHLPETALRLSLDETITLIQKLEENQRKILALKKKLMLAKEQTQVSIQKYNELYDLMPLGYFILSKHGKIIDINASGSHMLGKELPHLINSKFRLFVSDETKPIFDIFLRNAFCSQTDETSGITLISPDNLPIYVHLSEHITKNGEQCMVSMVDITERIQSEEKLKLLGRAIEQSPVMVVITDKEGNIRYTNPKFTEITGYSLNEVVGQNPRILKSGEQSSEFYNELWKTILSGNDWHGEFHNRKKNGDLYWESAVISSFVNDSGDIAYFFSVKEDITEKKQMIADLIKAKEKAEESDHLKTSFLNNISHEIRTPFNSILGFLSIIQDDDLTSSERDEYISIINKSACRLMNTINDIVEISQIQTGQMKLTASETNIKRLTGELFDLFKTDAESQKLEFTITNDLPDNIECISTDGIKLKTILSILIGNAIKFTKAGSIGFGIKCRDKANRRDKVEDHSRVKACLDPTASPVPTVEIEFSIKDTGIGISGNKQQAIFERFMQADGSNTRQFEGSGLGLSIAKAYVEMLDGKIWVKSEEGKGSTFYFTIPL
jgi:PAS domain S-box-containing protein